MPVDPRCESLGPRTADEPPDEELLARVLSDVIYELDVHARLPVDISIDTGPAGGGQGHAEVRFAAARSSEAELAGAIPKAVSLHGLRFGRTGDLWALPCQRRHLNRYTKAQGTAGLGEELRIP